MTEIEYLLFIEIKRSLNKSQLYWARKKRGTTPWMYQIFHDMCEEGKDICHLLPQFIQNFILSRMSHI